MTFFHIGLIRAGEGGGGRSVVDERYVTLGGVTVQRYKGMGGVKFSGKKRYVTLECPFPTRLLTFINCSCFAGAVFSLSRSAMRKCESILLPSQMTLKEVIVLAR